MYALVSRRSFRAAAATAASVSQRCRLHVSARSVRPELRRLPGHLRRPVVSVASNEAKYGGATTVAMRHAHSWWPSSLWGGDDVGPAAAATTTTTTTESKTHRGDDNRPKPISAGRKEADIVPCAGSAKRGSLQERLGITEKEAEKIRGDVRTTAPGYSILVSNPGSCSNGGGCSSSSSSSCSNSSRGRSRGRGRRTRIISSSSSSTTTTTAATSTSTSSTSTSSTRTSRSRGRGRTRTRTSSSSSSSSSTDTATSSHYFVEFLLDHLQVTKGAAKRLVLKNPAVLTMSGDAADHVCRWLQDKVGMDRQEVTQLLLAYPEAGQLSVEDTIKPAIAWLRKKLCPEKVDIVIVLRQAPHVLGQSVEGSLEPMVAMLEKKLGVSSNKAAKIAYVFPAIFLRSVKNKRDPTLVWLGEQLKSGDLSPMIDTVPNFHDMKNGTGLELKLAFLRDRVDLTPAEICRLIRNNPSIIRLGIENMESKLTWLKEALHLDDGAIKVVVMRCPRFMGASLDRLKLMLPWLEKTFNLTKEEAVALATRSTALLCSSIKSLDSNIAFYRDEMGASDEDLRRLVKNPRLLMSSVDGLLRPRIAKMKFQNIEPRFSQHVYPICMFTDDRFEKFLRSGGSNVLNG